MDELAADQNLRLAQALLEKQGEVNELKADLLLQRGIIQDLRDELASYKRGERHIIEFREDGWTIQHPLSCRPNLFDCIVNTAASDMIVPEAMAIGRYHVDVSEDGRMMNFEQIR